MPQVIPVDLNKTGGKLIPPEMMSATARPAGPPADAGATAPTTTSAAEPAAAKPSAAPGTPPESPPAPPACPHCGLNPKDKPTDVSAADRAEFVKAVLTGVPYAKEYSLFGGAVRVRFRVLDVGDADAAQAAMDKIEAAATFSANLQGAVARLHVGMTLYAAMSVDHVVLARKTHQPPADRTPDTVVAWFRGLVRVEVVAAALRNAYAEFAAVVGALQRQALDPSFS